MNCEGWHHIDVDGGTGTFLVILLIVLGKVGLLF